MGVLSSKQKAIEPSETDEDMIDIKPLILLRQDLMYKLNFRQKPDWQSQYLDKMNDNKPTPSDKHSLSELDSEIKAEVIAFKNAKKKVNDIGMEKSSQLQTIQEAKTDNEASPQKIGNMPSNCCGFSPRQVEQ